MSKYSNNYILHFRSHNSSFAQNPRRISSQNWVCDCFWWLVLGNVKTDHVSLSGHLTHFVWEIYDSKQALTEICMRPAMEHIHMLALDDTKLNFSWFELKFLLEFPYNFSFDQRLSLKYKKEFQKGD